GARVILVENDSRFARDLGVQLTGHALLKSLGFDLIPVDCPTHFTDETPTANLVRQILGAVSEFEKANLVAKLRAARDRLSVKVGRRIEGRDHTSDAARTRARELHGQKKTLRDIAAVLETEGHVGATGKRFTPSTVSRMVRS
ncbi:MAG: recombinase family protein, partial [Rhodothermales bacterium]|nr:recombinase family protein [Rhodothermales bacterium]